MSLAGKVALVTGGSRGIGAATALRLARDGADVAITYVKSPEAAGRVVDQIRALGRRAEAYQADAANPAGLRGLLAKVAGGFGRLDILVNNAGAFDAMPITDVKDANYDNTFNINLRAVYTLIQEAATVLQDGGRIVNIGSVLGQRVPFPGMTLYSTSKFAVNGLTRAAARELGQRGITVNNVQPGPIATDLNPDEGDFAETIKSMTILRRYGRAEEVAAAVAFLAGPEASYITGTNLNVDGGLEA